MSVDLRDTLRGSLKRHPRVAHQGFHGDAAAWSHLADSLPPIVPFGEAKYASGLWILDWDHRLPSRGLVLRLYAFYDETARERGLETLEEREADIAKEDKFPEFDVPDFSGLAADEAYEAELEPEGAPTKMRLVSDWRRDIDPSVARKAIAAARKSEAFQDLRKSTRSRPPGLGNLEAAEWSPPCESGHSRWGIDVWYLVSFNGVVGDGRAFLVDVDEGTVIRHREFQFRAG